MAQPHAKAALGALLCLLLWPSMALGQPSQALDEEEPLKEELGEQTAQPQQEDLDVEVQGRPITEAPGTFGAGDMVEVSRERGQSGDMGDVLGRSQGIQTRRTGGLGTPVDLSIHGLSGPRVRLFLDGVPAQWLGFGLGISTIPVDFIDWVEIYTGVVPVFYGSDALGGALDLVTRESSSGSLSHLSYQVASFGTRRASALLKVPLQEESGLYLSARAYHDQSDNDFKVELPLVNEQGREEFQRLPLFHNGYRAWGLQTELGIQHRPWARRARIWWTLSEQSRDVQSDPLRVFPYGDASYQEESQGLWGQWEYSSAPWHMDLLVGIAQRQRELQDTSHNRYAWDGRVIGTRRHPGEWSGGLLARLEELSPRARWNQGWELAPGHRLEFNFTPSYTRRRQRTRLLTSDQTTRDKQESGTAVVALAHRWKPGWIDLDQSFFLKGYGLWTKGEVIELLSDENGRQRDVTDGALGVGDGLLWRLTGWLSLRASYEWTTRLPQPEELFGDGVLVQPNLDLQPERSHNLNLATLWKLPLGEVAALEAQLQGFARYTDDLIFLVNYGLTSNHENIATVHTRGLEGGLTWRPSPWASLGGNLTWFDARNQSRGGDFARFDGQRIPNMPWLSGHLHGRLGHELGQQHLELYTYGQYTRGFFRFWEGEGDRDLKLQVPSQWRWTLGLSWRLLTGGAQASAEVQNLTAQRSFDNFGLELPGRSYHLKLSFSPVP